MKHIENNVIAEALRKRAEAGFHVDNRLLREVCKGYIYSMTIDDKDAFLSLIWQEIDDTRLLTPKGQPRTLRDVAERIVKGKHTFNSLATGSGRPPGEHKPTWFAKCLPIAQSFSYEKFGTLALVAANDSERAHSPNGTFYIYDGIHKTLVLSTLLIKGQTPFQPLDAILLVPRR